MTATTTPRYAGGVQSALVLFPLNDQLEISGDLCVELDAGAVGAGLLDLRQGHLPLVYYPSGLLLNCVHHFLGSHTARTTNWEKPEERNERL